MKALSRLLLKAALLMLIATGTQAGTMAIDDQAERIDLSNNLALLHDPGGQLHFSEVLKMATDFSAAHRSDLLRSFNAGVFWLRVSLLHSGTQPITRWLVVSTPKVDTITLFMPDAHSSDGWQVMHAGRSVPRTQKPVIASDAVFPITLQPGESRELLLRIVVRGATDMASTLWEPQAYRLSAGEHNLVLAGIMGGMLLSSLLSVIVFIRLRETRYLWLAVMLLAIAGVEAMRENLIGIYLWPEHLALPPQLLSAFAALAIFAMTKVVIAALDLPSLTALGNRLIFALRWIAILGFAYSFADYGAGVRMISLSAVILLPVSLVFSILAWCRKKPSAQVFTLAFALALLIETARQLSNLGMLPWAAAMDFSLAGFLLATPFILIGMIEQARQLSQQLLVAEQLQVAKTAFLTHVSHELRSPLNSILGHARMLQRGSARLSLQEGTANIEKSTLRLLTLIDELLDTSRAVAGKLAVSPAPTLFRPWLDDLCASIAIVIEAGGNRFICVCNGDFPTAVLIDGQRLRQVLENLLNNANRHTYQGEIRLECTAQIESTLFTLSFAVRDTGEGIAPEQLKMIFEPFVRGDASEHAGDSSRSGFGLGLPICRELVRQMGSEIGVSSAPKQGSCFSFTLQCPLVAPQAVDHLHAAIAPRSTGEFRPHVLLVDDNSLQLELLGDLLHDAGFVTHSAANGKAALVMLKQHAWDAIITDQMMADGDGWFVLQQARALTPSVLVILLSAVRAQRPADFPADLSFDAELGKPARPEELLATLWGLILNVSAGGMKCSEAGMAISTEQWQALATLVGDGDVSGIEDWIDALPESPVSSWARDALNRLDFDLLRRSSMFWIWQSLSSVGATVSCEQLASDRTC